MKLESLWAAAAAVAGLTAICTSSHAAEPLGKGMVMYMQMGGNAGDGATWARTNGALAAGDAFGIKIIEQYSAWQPEKTSSAIPLRGCRIPTCPRTRAATRSAWRR